MSNKAKFTETKLNPAVPVRTHTSHRTQSVERGPREHHEPHRQPDTTSPIANTTPPMPNLAG